MNAQGRKQQSQLNRDSPTDQTTLQLRKQYGISGSMTLITAFFIICTASFRSSLLTPTEMWLGAVGVCAGIIIATFAMYKIARLEQTGLEPCSKHDRDQVLKAYAATTLPDNEALHTVACSYAKVQLAVAHGYISPTIVTTAGLAIFFAGFNTLLLGNDSGVWRYWSPLSTVGLFYPLIGYLRRINQIQSNATALRLHSNNHTQEKNDDRWWTGIW